MSAAQDMTRALGGSWFGHYGVARCPAHDDHSPSLSISDGTTGRLLLKCHAGCSYAAVVSFLPLGQRDGLRPLTSPACSEAARRTASERAKRATAQARAIWDAGLSIEGTLAERYLRSRGITCPLPPMLRYAPDCWHLTAKRLPALLCKIMAPKGAAIHRTYLAPDGLDKARVTPSKAMLGQTKGGAVRLSDGPDKLVVAEGIQTALSLMSGVYPGTHSTWAALSASGMAALDLPPVPSELVIANDGDQAGRDAANRLANRAYALGWKVALLPAPDGKDWNDVLRTSGVQQ